MSFVKSDFGSEEDCLTDDVCLTRGDQYPMYNSVLESEPTRNGECLLGNPSPLGTLWAYGACNTIEPDQFGEFMRQDFAACNPPSVVGNPACLKIRRSPLRHHVRLLDDRGWRRRVRVHAHGHGPARRRLRAATGS